MARRSPWRALADALGFAQIGRAMGHRNYRVYIYGHAVNLIGLWIQRVAVGWLTWELTGSAAWLGIIALADMAPAILFAPIGGAIADRMDRKRLAVIAQLVAMVQAAALAGLTLSGLIDIWLLLGLSLVLGVNVSLWGPVRLAMVPNLVPREDVGTAVAFGSVIFNSARFVGPAIAGPIIVFSGVGLAFAVNALSYGAFLAALLLIDTPLGGGDRGVRRGLFREASAGIAYAARHPGIGPLLLLLLVGGVLARPVAELLPGFAEAVFARGAGGLAVMTSAMGVGSLVASLWLASRGPTTRYGWIVLASGILMGISLVALAATDVFVVGVAAAVAAAVGMSLNGIACQTMLQAMVPDAMRGRVLSLYILLVRAAPGIGALLMGVAAEFVGLRWPVAVAALVTIGIYGWAIAGHKRLGAALAPEATALVGAADAAPATPSDGPGRQSAA